MADVASRVNPPAQRAMKAIREQPELPRFLMEARKFSERAGFLTPEVKRLMDVMIAAGTVGAAQNMIGMAVHGVAEDSHTPKVLKAVRKAFPSAIVFATKLDDQGVRLQESLKPKH